VLSTICAVCGKRRQSGAVHQETQAGRRRSRGLIEKITFGLATSQDMQQFESRNVRHVSHLEESNALKAVGKGKYVGK
jgi:hypothetical protein